MTRLKLALKFIFYPLPIHFLLFVYFYKDPFKVLYHYDAYYQPEDTFYFSMCYDRITTHTFIQNYPAHKYDSYIFGSSRSGFFDVNTWGKHVGSDHYYNFSTAMESLYGVERKFQMLKDRKIPIKNALIALDDEILGVVANQSGHLLIKDPLITGESRFAFQAQFFKDFFEKDFIIPYLHMLFSPHPYAYALTDPIFMPHTMRYDVNTNEYVMDEADNKLRTDSIKYYETRKNIFYKRDTTTLHYAKPAIGVVQKSLLVNIKEILSQDNASYRIVINPLYDQLKMDTTDIKTLREIFGAQNVFDFSGINDITNNEYNYYEASHYRPRVADWMMNVIYK